MQTTGQRYDFSEQVALITGGGRGLGRAFALALATAGAKVVVTARTEEELRTTVQLIEASGGTAIYYSADVTDKTLIASIMADIESRFGPLDILVNNAGVLNRLAYDWEVDADEWWRTFEINVRGPYLYTQAVLPGMMARKKGKIVNVSSLAAYAVMPYATAYSASKAALSQMTNQLAMAVKDRGICVFAFAPSGASAMVEILGSSPLVPEQLRLSAREAMRTGAGVAESADMLMFLLSGEADVLTGRHISMWDDVEDLLRRSEEVVRDDLYTLRLRT